MKFFLLGFSFFFLAQHSWAQPQGPVYNFYFQNHSQQVGPNGPELKKVEVPAPVITPEVPSAASPEVPNAVSTEVVASPQVEETKLKPVVEEKFSTVVNFFKLKEFFKFNKADLSLVSEVGSSLRKKGEFASNGVGVGLGLKLGRLFFSAEFLNQNVKAAFGQMANYSYRGSYLYLEEYEGKLPGGKLTMAMDVVPITEKLILIMGFSGTLLKGSLNNKHFLDEKLDYRHSRFEGLAGVQWKLGHFKASLTYGLGEGRNHFINPISTRISYRYNTGREIRSEERVPHPTKKKERFTHDSLNLGLSYVF